MLLKGYLMSPEAKALMDVVLNTIIVPFRRTQGQFRPSMVPAYQAIIEAFLADLLRAAADGRWSKLSTDNEHLGTVPGGRTALGVMRSALGSQDYIEELPGYFRTEVSFGQKRKKHSRTCFRPTKKLIDLADELGVSLSSIRQHFVARPSAPPSRAEVLMLKAQPAIRGEKPKLLPLPKDDPRCSLIIQDLQELNAFLMHEGRIAGFTFAGLRRSFNNADHPDFSYQWHGRYYSMLGADRYEAFEGGKETRERLIIIDGLPSRELDISASHLTILHGLLGVPFDSAKDPYELDGVKRDTVKQWVVLALGSSGASNGGNPLLAAKRVGLKRYPFLSQLHGLGIGPLDLHYHEAEIIRLAMESLMKKGVGFLPVHDALLVADGNQGLAEEAIKEGFSRYFIHQLGMTSAPEPILK
ncbi:hypothetical protein GRI44_13105 [Altererythrobacter confluentis]|uniref:Uncharacterized protein n=1 Tax=Allopontixanthobacter confluentis TaxID=1849021 RepID=A0A6L7GIC6_9SPHN|nr:hypothetical protein [Allopontixanthobacter confluentis]MXP15687.1 hypothetical protein [Allopontixanthobacter confluentis]